MKYVITLLILLIILLSPLLVNPKILTGRSGDFADLVMPDYFFIKQSILEQKQIPLWNPYIFSGLPEIVNPQSPLLYFPNLLALLFDINLSIVFLVLIHLFVSGLFMFMIGRKVFKWEELQSAVLMFAFVFSPFLWSKFSVGHISMFFAMCIVSPIIYFSLKLLKDRSFKQTILLAFFLALQYLNYPTIWYYTVLFGLISFAIYFLLVRKWNGIFSLVTGLILSLMLLSPILLIQLRSGGLITRSSLSLTDLTIPLWSITRFLKSIFIPASIIGDVETEVWLYPSLVALFLSLFAIYRLRRNLKILVITVGTLVLLITLGNRTPFFEVLVRFVPGFSYLRVVTRDWFVLTTLIAFLTSLGFSYIKPSFRKVVLLALCLDLLVNSQLVLWHIPVGLKPNPNTPTIPLSDVSSNEYRYYCVRPCLSFSSSVERGLLRADGYHLVILKTYEKALSDAGGFDPVSYNGYIPSYHVEGSQPSAEKLGRLSVKWVIASKQLTDPGFVFIRQQDSFSLYENKKAMKRIRFKNQLGDIKVVEDKPNSIILETKGASDRLIIADNYFPGWEVYVDGKPTKIEIEDGWAKSVQVPPGAHHIEFRYNPFNNFKIHDF